MSFDENEMVCFDLEQKIQDICTVLGLIFIIILGCVGMIGYKYKNNEKMIIKIIGPFWLFILIIIFGIAIFSFVRNFI